MASIYENLTTIKENIDVMKEVLGIDSTTPLELVTKTIEEKMGSSVAIHNVVTLEEMNNIEANDGDVCVISETVYKPLQEDTVTDTFYFLKDVIEYPEPIITSPEGFYMGVFSPDESKFTFNIVIKFMDVNAGLMDMANPQLQAATYMALPPDGESGRKYVRNTDMPPELINRVLKTPIPVSCVSGWTDYFSEFVSVEGKETTGIYIHKNSSWMSITDNQEIINLILQSLPDGDEVSY